MSTNQVEAQNAAQKLHERQSLEAVIRDNVMHDLGRPAALHQVQVRLLWDNHFRVNVFVGADAASAKVADSFFLQTDGDGKVLVSAPPITRRY
jgi:hypothetical protein